MRYLLVEKMLDGTLFVLDDAVSSEEDARLLQRLRWNAELGPVY